MTDLGTSLVKAGVARLDAPPASAFLGPAPGTRDIAKVAREFAGLFYSMMVSEMQKTVPQNGYFGGRGEEVFRALWVNELGRRMAERPGDPLASKIIEDGLHREGGLPQAPGGEPR